MPDATHPPSPDSPSLGGPGQQYPHPRPFVLVRDVDGSGVSGTGVVAEGVEFSDGTAALRWTSAWPTSVVFHDRGIASVEAIHGHSGATRIVYLDATPADAAPVSDEDVEDAVQIVEDAIDASSDRVGQSFHLANSRTAPLAVTGLVRAGWRPTRPAAQEVPGA